MFTSGQTLVESIIWGAIELSIVVYGKKQQSMVP